jgi:hypothetical protein
VDTTLITDMLTGGNAITVHIKVGTSIELVTDTQDTHLLTELNSRSSQECQPTELSSGMNILVDIKTDSELETTIQRTTSNGGHSMTEPRPLELGQEETSLLPIKKDINSELVLLLLSEFTETLTTRESDGTMEDIETSETTEENVWKLLVPLTLT